MPLFHKRLSYILIDHGLLWLDRWQHLWVSLKRRCHNYNNWSYFSDIASYSSSVCFTSCLYFFVVCIFLKLTLHHLLIAAQSKVFLKFGSALHLLLSMFALKEIMTCFSLFQSSAPKIRFYLAKNLFAHPKYKRNWKFKFFMVLREVCIVCMQVLTVLCFTDLLELFSFTCDRRRND